MTLHEHIEHVLQGGFTINDGVDLVDNHLKGLVERANRDDGLPAGRVLGKLVDRKFVSISSLRAIEASL